MKKRPSTIAIHALAALGVLALVASQAHAAVVVVAPTASTSGSLTITNDITFNITTAGNASIFALDEWVTTDGAQNSSPFANLLISHNGGAPFTQSASLFDNLNSNSGALTANDGYIFQGVIGFGVAVGDTVTLKPATYILGPTGGFNPQANQAFTGNMFVADASGNQLSNVVAASGVPEPSTAAMLLLGGLGIVNGSRRSGRTASQG